MFHFKDGRRPMAIDARYTSGFLQVAEQQMRAGTAVIIIIIIISSYHDD